MNPGRLRTSHFACGLAGVAALCAGGCSNLSAPTMSLSGVSLVQTSDEAAVVEFMYDVTNSNVEEIPLRDFEYVASIDGRALPATRCAAEATVRRLGTQQMSIPVVIPFTMTGGMPHGTRRLTITGRLSYIAPGAIGEMLFDTGVRVPKISFSDSVDLNFPAQVDGQ